MFGFNEKTSAFVNLEFELTFDLLLLWQTQEEQGSVLEEAYPDHPGRVRRPVDAHHVWSVSAAERLAVGTLAHCSAAISALRHTWTNGTVNICSYTLYIDPWIPLILMIRFVTVTYTRTPLINVYQHQEATIFLINLKRTWSAIIQGSCSHTAGTRFVPNTYIVVFNDMLKCISSAHVEVVECFLISDKLKEVIWEFKWTISADVFHHFWPDHWNRGATPSF